MAVQYPWHVMKIINNNHGLTGSGIASERGIRFRSMIQAETKRRVFILDFWKKYGKTNNQSNGRSARGFVWICDACSQDDSQSIMTQEKSVTVSEHITDMVVSRSGSIFLRSP